jgi:hypothetical protein
MPIFDIKKKSNINPSNVLQLPSQRAAHEAGLSTVIEIPENIRADTVIEIPENAQAESVTNRPEEAHRYEQRQTENDLNTSLPPSPWLDYGISPSTLLTVPRKKQSKNDLNEQLRPSENAEDEQADSNEEDTFIKKPKDQSSSRTNKVFGIAYLSLIAGAELCALSKQHLPPRRTSGPRNQPHPSEPNHSAFNAEDAASSLRSYDPLRDSHQYQHTFSGETSSQRAPTAFSPNEFEEETMSAELDEILKHADEVNIPAQYLAYRDSTDHAHDTTHRPPPIDDDELQAELQIIERLTIPEFSFTPTERNKRAVANSPTTHGEIQVAVKSIATSDAYPLNFRQTITAIRKKVNTEMHSKGVHSNHIHSHYLVVFIKLLQADLDQHSAKEEFPVSYHYLYMALKEAWKIAEKINNQPIQNYLRKMKNEMGKRGMPELMKSMYVNMKYNEIDLIAGMKINTYGRKMAGRDNEIVFHTPTGTRILPFSQLYSPLHKTKLNGILIEHTHRKGDHTGIRDLLLESMFSERGYEDFQAFHEEDEYKEFIKLKARHLLSNALEPFYVTHGMPNKTETLTNIINQINVTPELVTDISNQDLQQSLATMRDKKHNWDDMEMTTAVQSLVTFKQNADRWFPGLDINSVAENSYVYRYTDDFGKTQYDTTTLAEILCAETAVRNIDIAKRKNVEITFPEEYGHDFIWGKNQIAKEMKSFFESAKEIERIAYLQPKLLENLPNIGKILWNKYQFVALHFFDSPPDPNEEDTLIYTPTLGTEKRFNITLNAILLGDLGKQIYGAPPDAAEGDPEIFKLKKNVTLLEFIVTLQNNHVADRIKTSLQEAKKNPVLKADYNEYIQLLIKREISGRTDLHAKFYHVPLLDIYFQEPVTSEGCSSSCKFQAKEYTQKDIPLFIFSRITGQSIWFKSMAEFNALYATSSDLRGYIKAHAFADEHKFLHPLRIINAPTSSLFDQSMNFFATNFDKITVTTSENIRLAIADFIIDITPYITIFVPNAYLGAAISVIIRGGARATQAMVLNHKDDREQLARLALAESANTIAGAIAGAQIKKLGEKMFSSTLSRIPDKIKEKPIKLMDDILSIYSGLIPAKLPFSLPDSTQGLAGLASKKGGGHAIKSSVTWAIDRVWEKGQKAAPIKFQTELINTKNIGLSANLDSRELTVPTIQRERIPIRSASDSATSNTATKTNKENYSILHTNMLRDPKTKRT